MLLYGLLHQMKFFEKRKTTLLASFSVFLIGWNILWSLLSEIPSLDDANAAAGRGTHFKLNQLRPFDYVMFQVSSGVQYMVYYAVLISGPVDICRIQVLKENLRIYALLLCTTVGLKTFFEALVVDANIESIEEYPFLADRSIIIGMHLLCLALLFSIVREEIDSIGQTASTDQKTEVGRVVTQNLRPSESNASRSRGKKSASSPGNVFGGEELTERDIGRTASQQSGRTPKFIIVGDDEPPRLSAAYRQGKQSSAFHSGKSSIAD